MVFSTRPLCQLCCAHPNHPVAAPGSNSQTARFLSMFFLGALWPWAIQSEHGWGGDYDVRGCFGSLPFLRDLLCWLDPSSLWGPSGGTLGGPRRRPLPGRVRVLWWPGYPNLLFVAAGALVLSFAPLHCSSYCLGRRSAIGGNRTATIRDAAAVQRDSTPRRKSLDSSSLGGILSLIHI